MGGEGVEDIKQTVLVVSLIVFVLSYFALWYISKDITPVVTSISNVPLGQKVTARGIVVWQKNVNGVYIGEISTGEDKFRFFSHTRLPKQGNYTGVVKVYKGERELVV